MRMDAGNDRIPLRMTRDRLGGRARGNKTSSNRNLTDWCPMMSSNRVVFVFVFAIVVVPLGSSSVSSSGDKSSTFGFLLLHRFFSLGLGHASCFRFVPRCTGSSSRGRTWFFSESGFVLLIVLPIDEAEDEKSETIETDAIPLLFSS